MPRLHSLLLALALVTLAGCDCENNCERDYRDCLEDPTIGTLECDLGYDQCLTSCSGGLGLAPDGG